MLSKPVTQRAENGERGSASVRVRKRRRRDPWLKGVCFPGRLMKLSQSLQRPRLGLCSCSWLRQINHGIKNRDRLWKTEQNRFQHMAWASSVGESKRETVSWAARWKIIPHSASHHHISSHLRLREANVDYKCCESAWTPTNAPSFHFSVPSFIC